MQPWALAPTDWMARRMRQEVQQRLQQLVEQVDTRPQAVVAAVEPGGRHAAAVAEDAMAAVAVAAPARPTTMLAIELSPLQVACLK